MRGLLILLLISFTFVSCKPTGNETKKKTYPKDTQEESFVLKLKGGTE